MNRKRAVAIGAIPVVVFALAAAVLVATADDTKSQASPHEDLVTGTVWVANEDGGSLTAIDAASNTVATTLTGIESPHNVQASADGRSVWAVSGTTSMAVKIDSSSLAVTGTVATGAMPTHVVVTPDLKTSYVSNNADNTVTAINTTTMESTATIAVGTGPHGLRPSPDGEWIYVANIGGTTLSVIDTATNSQVAEVEVGTTPAQVAFSPDGRFVYTSLSGEGAVAKVDVATRKLVAKTAVGPGPIQTFVSPDNKFLLVANQGTKEKPGTTVSVLDTETFTVLQTVKTGKGAHGVVVDPSSRHAYITNMFEDSVAVLDLKSLKVVSRIPVGSTPNGISFSTQVVKRSPATGLDLRMDSNGAPSMGH
ncbi:cytochrome D1 domain-containing protein [Cryobacterium fucosi]|uniref:YNCE-like beta-propeller domain-containing protein n=1 Tax=Cryobacterium fucosi TaxID=1259157 RepID=A0A4R9B944_9MICO|nr:cytochrome D1 domain-containing protein [Cryobacterium fucosi]TFD78281.1 hypothetical protein E3T48_07545 [Cryobacterium fucosi]